MANIKVRYFVTKPGRDGDRHFWQPAKPLRQAGWTARRLSDDAAAAIGEAKALNDSVDDWRLRGSPPLDGQAAGVAAAPAAGTVAALVAAYRASTKYYGGLKPTSKKLYDFALDIIVTWAGDMPARSVTAEAVDKLYEDLRAVTPAKANSVVAVLRLLFNFAVRYRWVRYNPAIRPKMVALPFSGIIWPRGAVEAFVAKADALGMYGLGTALLLNFWIGHNPIDVFGLPRAVYRNGDIRLERSKTGRRAVLPVDMIGEVSDRLAGELARQAAAGVTPLTLIVRHRTWQQYTPGTFSEDFRKLRAAVAAETPAFAADGDADELIETARLKFRYLRHTAITTLAVCGCDALQIASITTHSLQTINQVLEFYFDRTRAVAASAFEKRLAKESEG